VNLDAVNRAGAALTEEETTAAVALLGGAASLVVATIDPTGIGAPRFLTITPASVEVTTDGDLADAVVTVRIDAATAAALDAGSLSPARAIAEGRTTISGDAALLARAQNLLSSVLSRVAP
jgi:ubiquinone biosynthesis protein UbiJ